MSDTNAALDPKTEAVLGLPFVERTHDGDLRYWSIEPTGDQARDIYAGERFADLALRVARDFDLPGLVTEILRDMILAGQFTRIEAGFVVRIASAARMGSMI